MQTKSKSPQDARNMDDLWNIQARSLSTLEEIKTLHQLKLTECVTNAAGKMMNNIKVRLAACALVGVEPNIPQLGQYRGEKLLAAPATTKRRRVIPKR